MSTQLKSLPRLFHKCVSFLLEMGGTLGGCHEPGGVRFLVLSLPSRTYIPIHLRGKWPKGSSYREQNAFFSFSFFFFLMFLSTLCNMQDLNSLTRDQTRLLPWECRVSTTGVPEKSEHRMLSNCREHEHYFLYFLIYSV